MAAATKQLSGLNEVHVMAATEAESAELTAAMLAFLQEPHNRKCADCSAKLRAHKDAWASVRAAALTAILSLHMFGKSRAPLVGRCTHVTIAHQPGKLGLYFAARQCRTSRRHLRSRTLILRRAHVHVRRPASASSSA